MSSLSGSIHPHGQRQSGPSAAYMALDPVNKAIVDMLKVQFEAGTLQLDLVNEVLEPWVKVVLPGPPYRNRSTERTPQQPDTVVADNQPTASSSSEVDVQNLLDGQLRVEGERPVKKDVEIGTHDEEEGSGSDTNERYYTPRPWDYHTPSPPSTISDLTDLPDTDDDGSEPGLYRARSDANHRTRDQEVQGHPNLPADIISISIDAEVEEDQETPKFPADTTANPIDALLITKIQDAVAFAAQKANEAGDPILGQVLNALLNRSVHNPRLLNLLDAICGGRQTETRARHFKILLKYEHSQLEYGKQLPKWYSDLPLASRQRLALSEKPLDMNKLYKRAFRDAEKRWNELLLTQWRDRHNIEPPPPLTPQKVAGIITRTRKSIEQFYEAGKTTISRALNLLGEQATRDPAVMILLDEPARANNGTREKVFQIYLKYAKQELKRPGSRKKWFSRPDRPNNEDDLKAQDSGTEFPPRKKRRLHRVAEIDDPVIKEEDESTSSDVIVTSSPYNLRSKTARRPYGR
ncbi:MAG: hypothetical protein L6R42_007095 [Xanthoria sp. 1 TBL-2021]|nr:MAG: hypothetical protein L6R42_007095 [Xanthoria sp. 1 TBL-2021]